MTKMTILEQIYGKKVYYIQKRSFDVVGMLESVEEKVANAPNDQEAEAVWIAFLPSLSKYDTDLKNFRNQIINYCDQIITGNYPNEIQSLYKRLKRSINYFNNIDEIDIAYRMQQNTDGRITTLLQDLNATLTRLQQNPNDQTLKDQRDLLEYKIKRILDLETIRRRRFREGYFDLAHDYEVLEDRIFNAQNKAEADTVINEETTILSGHIQTLDGIRNYIKSMIKGIRHTHPNDAIVISICDEVEDLLKYARRVDDFDHIRTLLISTLPNLVPGVVQQPQLQQGSGALVPASPPTQAQPASGQPTGASTQTASGPVGSGTQTSTAPGSPGQNIVPVQIDPAVLEYAALLRARERIFQGSYHVKDVLSRENAIVQNYRQYLRQRLSAGRDDNERAQILQQEMELLKSVTYHETVRDGINRWWRRHPVARMVIGLGMLGAGIAAMFVNPLLGAALLIARGLWNGVATWMAVEGGYDALNHVWRRSREDGAHRIIRSIMTNRNIEQQDIIDAVHMGPDVTVDRIVAGGLDVTRNIRGHRIVKRILSIAAGTIVGMVTGIWQGITSLFSAHDGVSGGVGFGDHVKQGVHEAIDKANAANGYYVYTAEPGGSIWRGAEQAIDWYAAQQGIHLTPAERLYAVDALKDHVCANLPAHDVFRTVPTDAPTAPWIYQNETVIYHYTDIKNAINMAKNFFASGGKLYMGGGELLDGAGAFGGTGKTPVSWAFDTIKGKWEPVVMMRR